MERVAEGVEEGEVGPNMVSVEAEKEAVEAGVLEGEEGMEEGRGWEGYRRSAKISYGSRWSSA